MYESDLEEFIVYKQSIYKKVGVVGSLIKNCQNCNQQFFTKEQRRKYCTNACKTAYWRKENV